MDDQELNRVLREWKAPDAPSHLRPRRAPRPWWAWLATGSIRVPVPVAAALTLALVALSVVTARTQPASTPQPSAPRRSGEVARYPLSGPLAGFDAVIAELNFGPGVSAAEHRHPGVVVGYVVDGQMRTAVNRGQDEIVPAGGTFFEPTGILHSAFGSASATAPVRVLAFMVVPSGSGLTVRRDPPAQTPAQSPAPAAMPYVANHHPEFVPATGATFLQDDDIVLGVASGTAAKAFPAGDLSQHGSVFDEMPDGPVSVTWCGVCNTGLVFRADVKGRTLHFQYDRMVAANEVQKDLETGSSWQQATGEAIDGPLKGTRLTLYPSVRTTWGVWRRRYPRTLVLKPLPGYAELMPSRASRVKDITRVAPDGAPKGALAVDARLPPRETVAGLEVGGETVAYPFSALRVARVVNDRVGGLPVVIVHQPSSDTTTAFDARVNGAILTFQAANGEASSLTDRETHSRWNAYGLCLEGKLKGTQLKQVLLVPQFWFAWSQFRPGTKVFTAR
jgi:quercetin dioxygenase-like cupin family protein